MSRLKIVGTGLVMLGVLGVLAYGPMSALRYSDEIPSGRGAVDDRGGVDARRLAPLYKGRVVSPREIYRLQRKGLAQTSVMSRGLACQGVIPYFDTAAEEAAFTRANPVVTARPSPGCGTIAPHPAFADAGER